MIRLEDPGEPRRRNGSAWGLAALTSIALLVIFFNRPQHISQSQFPWQRNDGGVRSEQFLALGKSFERDHSIAEALFIENPSEEVLAESLREYTKHPHLAGNRKLAEYTRDKWLDYGIEDVQIVEYEVLLNRPTNRSFIDFYRGEMIDRPTWSAVLKEDVLEEDHGSNQAVPFFHGYSKNGTACGNLIYLNYASPADFDAVLEAGISLEGKIGIARYGHLFRGIKVELAQRHGMAAMLLYDDPSEDGNVTTENGHLAYPLGPARNPSAVQRGSVQFLSLLPGDPTTPGYASKPGCKRQPSNFSIPSIPSLPISGRDAKYLLSTLNGHGPSIKGFKGAVPNVEYTVGDGPGIVSLANVVEYDYLPIYNVIAKIPGHFEDEVILGNHRDAWVRGASDPNSGSAALDSIAATFAALQQTGYTPLRTLVLASWDAEEYGLVGSTEWVEECAKDLKEKAAVYLNVDVASAGQKFHCAASPLLHSAIRKVTESVPALSGDLALPGVHPIKSLADEWSGEISTLGSGSDYTAFQDLLGITSSDFGFGRSGRDAAVYHYHSQYDSYHWLTQFGDKKLKGLQASARVWGLLAYRMLESPVIDLNATLYGEEVRRYVKELPKSVRKHHKHQAKKLVKAAKKIEQRGRKLDKEARKTNARVKDWSRLANNEKLALLKDVARLNNAYKQMERAFVDPHGMKDRPFFKHVLYSPGRWTGYAGVVFGSLREAAKEDLGKAYKRLIKVLDNVGKFKK
jgi:N-acetylated-alpha-linked acidic dipeptidase